jgi:hypothetical protein
MFQFTVTAFTPIYSVCCVLVQCSEILPLGDLVFNLNGKYGSCLGVTRYSVPASYVRLDIRPSWDMTKGFVLTYDQISGYDPRQRHRVEHISGITLGLLRAPAEFVCFAGATMLIYLIKVCTV